jgi:hypothetical protein
MQPAKLRDWVELMERFNLWLTIDQHSKVLCFGPQCEMNDIALHCFAGMGVNVHVLPDGYEPEPLTTSDHR